MASTSMSIRSSRTPQPPINSTSGSVRRRYAFDEAGERLTRLWANALGLRDERSISPIAPAGR
jgi:hypothetical protein